MEIYDKTFDVYLTIIHSLLYYPQSDSNLNADRPTFFPLSKYMNNELNNGWSKRSPTSHILISFAYGPSVGPWLQQNWSTSEL